MTAPLLNRALELQDRQLAPDGSGGFVVSWQSLGTLYADIVSRRGTERIIGGRMVPSVTYIITVRAAPKGAPSRPEPEQRFVDGARIFTILAVSEADRHGGYLECWAEEGTET